MCFPDSSPASTPGMCLNVYLYCSRAHSSCDLPSKSFCGLLDPVVLADFWSLYICDRYACLRTQTGPVFAWILPEPAAASVQLHAQFFRTHPFLSLLHHRFFTWLPSMVSHPAVFNLCLNYCAGCPSPAPLLTGRNQQVPQF